MEVFTHYEVGIKALAIEQKLNGRVEFTLWATVFLLPVWPLSSWSATYAGPVRPDGIKEDGHRFDDAVRIERHLVSFAQTRTASIIMLAIAIAPIGYLISGTTGRAATSIEIMLVFASCAWPVVVVSLVERRRRRLLTVAWT
jgi:hypothetical protein